MKTPKRAARLPIHPFLAAAYPIALLYASNLHEAIRFKEVAGPLALALIGAGILFALFRAVFPTTGQC